MVRIHHIALGAFDVPLMAQFYRDRFHLEEVNQHHDEEGSLRSIWLAAGGTVLMIEKIHTPPNHAPFMSAGPFLLAFQTTEEGKERARSDLRAQGIEIESETDWTTYFRDPEGNRVALSHYPANNLPD